MDNLFVGQGEVKRMFRVHAEVKPGMALKYGDGGIHVVQGDGSHRNPNRVTRLPKKERRARQRMLRNALCGHAPALP
jgi:hypothetical protein